MNKTNIVVFRKGGYLAARERWTYNGAALSVVNAYKYLGIFFSTRLSFQMACKDLASRAKNALLCILQKMSKLKNNSLSLYLKLFDAQIQPIAQYGAELWGLDKAAHHCEKVHLFALKRFLAVEMRTPNDFVYGETNRHPIYINSVIRCIRYWLKLTRMNESRLPRKAYGMLCSLDARDKRNWVSNIRCKLYMYGFGYVWENQGVVEINHFVHEVKDRLVSCRWQEWENHVRNSDRFDIYRTFCTVPNVKTYLLINLDKHLKTIMARFRLGISEIMQHYYRYRNHTEADLTCPMCGNSKEDEVHFVLCCPALDGLRNQYIPQKCYNFPSQFRLSLLLACEQESIVRNFSIYLYKAFKLRNDVFS
eukprot:TRINITY_DN43758_c0_g1_i1.p1 TRINITY_DN43758_c0_g1~~TRINITY_DN43758_c0_g1_i1.p1  ORF type:complete len:378 (+),score=6.98 TRINITY_DN43758_c0_g1_i1:45-1136(+)